MDLPSGIDIFIAIDPTDLICISLGSKIFNINFVHGIVPFIQESRHAFTCEQDKCCSTEEQESFIQQRL